jgi:hypothetical protein
MLGVSIGWDFCNQIITTSYYETKAIFRAQNKNQLFYLWGEELDNTIDTNPPKPPRQG